MLCGLLGGRVENWRREEGGVWLFVRSGEADVMLCGGIPWWWCRRCLDVRGVVGQDVQVVNGGSPWVARGRC